MSTLKLENINKIYPNGVQAVFDFNLEVYDGEFIVFVGPSGCGKSTTLRMIAGLEPISSGTFYINGEPMNDKPPKDRDIAMVFQSYALYPHMTVYDNLAFGLMLRKMPKPEIDRRVKEAAEMLELTPYLRRKPKALSGGQRQRVALGRAIVRNAKVFLLDEPLSNLDAKLRVQMRTELVKLHKRIAEQFQTTSIYVTHDQVEAMTMANRIVVMSHGYMQQVDVPKVIYEEPVNMFVAGFMGTPPMNFITGVVKKDGYFVTGDTKIEVPASKLKIIKDNDFLEKEIVLGIRPEDIHTRQEVIDTYPGATFEITATLTELLGSETNIFFSINEQPVTANVEPYPYQIGDKIKVAFDMNRSHYFDPLTELRLVSDKKVDAADAPKKAKVINPH